MPYRFKTSEPVEKGFRRIAGEQLDTSLGELGGPEVGAGNVHECRKSLKRLRALVRLVADAIGKDKARRLTKSLGEIARLLSARRDQTVMLQTIAKLSKDDPEAGVALTPLRAELVSGANDQSETLDAETAAKARQRLLYEAKKIARMKFGKRGFGSLAGGLETSYRRARKAVKSAYGNPTDTNFHDLRKAVQWHWRQMSLLARVWPDEFEARVKAAKELSQLLGDDHDLAMLVAAASGSTTLSAEQKEVAVSICIRHQQILRATAEFRVKRLFAEKPTAFVSRVGTYWRYSRSLDPRLEVPVVSRQVEGADEISAAQPQALGPAEEKRRVSAKPRLATQSEVPAAPTQRRA